MDIFSYNIGFKMVGNNDLVQFMLMVLTTGACLGFMAVYFLCPCFIIETWMKFRVWWSGLKRKFVCVNGVNLCYGEKGQQSEYRPSIIFIHGFSADHYMWAPIAQRIPDSYHVIALDQPGHGGSDDPHESESICYYGQVKKVYEFIQHMKLDKEKKLHIVGLSMGGTVGGLFAAEYPHLIHKVTICCPSMQTPSASEFARNLEDTVNLKGEDEGILACGLLPQTPSEIQNMMNLSHYYPTTLPQQILQGAADMRKKRNVFFLKLFRSLAENPSTLEDNIHRITSPVQIIWGKNDSIIDVSGLKVLQEKVTNCQSVEVIQCCGHVITIDQPNLMTKYLLNFHHS